MRGGVAVLRWLLALSLTATGSAALAQACPATNPEAIALLEAFARRAEAVSYEGVLTLQRGNSLRMMSLRHGVADARVSEDLTLLSGQEARIVRGEHPLDCEHPGHRLLRLAVAPEQGACGLAGHYRISTAPGERVAGRHAVRLLLQPRDLYRYGYVFELDRESAVLLKGTILGAGGRPLEQFQFASVSVGADADADAERPPAAVIHQAAHPHPALPREDGDSGLRWAPGWLPAGFVATDAAGVHSVHRSYTDGMATFSVFVESLGEALRPGEGVVREGSTVSYTRGLTLGTAPVLVTVLGEIPVNTARMVADAVRQVR
ncbi:MucB/RseB C-terminal domain-containing protein [Pseudohaliea rubra]|uniref:Sigma factor RpoE negative regulatory protein RseB n=1 Tax=Pseudohaliea rubra DSM 19751 TaxID=1265313 RepID=A0A095VQE4_9GAMM|nr:MucB/RseB C-terminal domain-containing protein [Pseudohaliea rubra]KGE03348.1 Sigma factor RpoE negative regulatory protein RseB precursor [Pseudohaliea rubra DSM 19751]